MKNRILHGGVAFLLLGLWLGCDTPVQQPEPSSPVSTTPSPGKDARTAAGFGSQQLWSTTVDWEPTVAVDPNTDDVYQMTTRYTGPRPCPRCLGPFMVFRRSSDGGQTWQQDQFLFVDVKGQADPQLYVDHQGTVHAAFLRGFDVLYTQSTDRGVTWRWPVPLTARDTRPLWSDKPILLTSADGQHVYIAYSTRDSFIATSRDGGTTFEQAIQTSSDRHEGFWLHAGGAVAPDGTVFFTVARYHLDYSGSYDVYVIRSTDQGQSWETLPLDTGRQVPSCTDVTPDCYRGQFSPTPVVAIDPAGRIIVAYNASTELNTAPRLFVRTSVDNGQSWSARMGLDEGGDGITNTFPLLAAGPMAGDFRLVWMDNRTGRFNTWHRRTLDGGRTWTTGVRLSDRSDGASYKSPEGFVSPYGDYGGLAVDRAGTLHAIWGEGEGFNGRGGSWYTTGQ
jgi:hypothetical protein